MNRSRFLAALAASVVGAYALSAVLTAAQSVADAAQSGDREAVRALLRQAADVNAAQADGMTALHWAATNGDAEMTDMLLFAGGNIRATTRIGGYTPLFLASQNGHAAVMRALIKAGADAKAASPTGTTMLMVASASGKTDAVQVLVDAGVEVNAAESLRGNTAVMYAAATNRAAVIELLASKGANLKATTKVIDIAGFTRNFEGGNPAPPGQAQQQGNNRLGFGPSNPAPGAPPGSPGGPGGPGGGGPGGRGGPGGPGGRPQVPGIDRAYGANELIGAQGGLTPLLYAVRQGHTESVEALLRSGADVNQVCAGDKTSPLLMAVINGHFDIAKSLLDRGADPTLAGQNGVTPLYGVVNVQWAPKALYPQPRAYQQQHVSYLEMMKALLDKGADPNARIKMKVWYSGYSFDLSGVDEIGATAFWRAAYASDVDAMKLLASRGADPGIPTFKPAGRPRFGDVERDVVEVAGLPPIPTGGPSVSPLAAAAGVGYGEGFAANAHRFAPGGMMAAVKYLVEELGADVNAADHEGNTPLHNAASRGDNEMILYLVSKGANVMAVNREGKTTVDMANGPVQRIQPFPETIALLEKLGAKNNHKCVSC
jgi:ankyrin repeat protein